MVGENEEHAGSAREASEYERLRSQAEGGDAKAQVALGHMLVEGGGEDDVQAAEWYLKATNNAGAECETLVEARLSLGDMGRDGRGFMNEHDALSHDIRAAELGSFRGQFNVGRAYADGRVIPRDDEFAVVCYRHAAEGYFGAAFALGLMYETGRGVAKDGAQAAFWFEKAIEDSNSIALPSLLPIMAEYGFANPHFIQGLMYEHGWTVTLDDTEAERHYREAIEQHAVVAKGRLSHSNVGKERGANTQAFEWCRKAAEQGDPAAQNALGLMYEDGWGIDPDHKQAFDWYQKAAERGLPQAQTNLGRMYSEGRGVARDLIKDDLWSGARRHVNHEREAVAWFGKAADQGFPEAQYRLGLAYYRGSGVGKNLEEARVWLNKAADQGHLEAQYTLSKPGIEWHKDTMLDWLSRAAEQGHSDAQYELGDLYATESYIGPSDKDALIWFRKAAAQGHVDAQWRLGEMYKAGRSDAQRSDALAAFWLLKAAEQEPGPALIELSLLLWSGGQTAADAILQSAACYREGLATLPEALAEMRRVMRRHKNDK